MNFERQTLMHARHARMVGRLFVGGDAQERGERSAIAATPGDATLRRDAFEVADENHAKVDAGWNRRPPDLGSIERLAAFFDPAVELGLGQNVVQFLIKGMPRRFRQLGGSDPQPLLFAFAFSQSHRDLGLASIEISADGDYCTMPVKRPFSTG